MSYSRIKVGDSITWIKQFRGENKNKRHFLSQVLEVKKCEVSCSGVHPATSRVKCERRILVIDGFFTDRCEFAFETVTERQEFLYHILGKIVEEDE